MKNFFRQHEGGPVDSKVGKALGRMSKRDFIEDVKVGESDIADADTGKRARCSTNRKNDIEFISDQEIS